MNPTVVVAGSLAQKPGRGGHAWVFLQYLLGFRRLGFDVVFVDRLAGEPAAPEDRSRALGWVSAIMRGAGLSDRFAVLDQGGRSAAGLPLDGVVAALEESALLLNVNGFLSDPELLGRAPRPVYLDIDPGVPQIWREQGLHDAFAGHEAFATFGERVGQEGCRIPTCGLPWIPTRPPVVLAEWPQVPAAPDRIFTSVASWRGAYGPLEHEGVSYGLRVHEFRRYAAVPHRVGARFSVALDIHSADASDAALLEAGGWTLVDPLVVAGDPESYRSFIRGSSAEFQVAKGMYVASGSGWFSDRSACYLASGRPVVAQDTGSPVPCGAGLLRFRTPREAVRAASEVLSSYPEHRREARRLAERHLDSDLVLSRLLGDLGIGSPPPDPTVAPGRRRRLTGVTT